MKVSQISVFLENQVGRLASAIRLLADEGVNIRALSVADTSDFGILRLIVNDPSKAYQVLREAGWAVNRTNVIAIEVPDHPGGLSAVLDTMTSLNINIEYMYAFVAQSNGNAVVIFSVKNMDEAIQALVSAGCTMLTSDQVYSL